MVLWTLLPTHYADVAEADVAKLGEAPSQNPVDEGELGGGGDH